MKKYFTHKWIRTNGPFHIDYLKKQNIKRETMLWIEGTDTWTKAGDIPELKEILAEVPPKFPWTPIRKVFSALIIVLLLVSVYFIVKKPFKQLIEDQNYPNYNHHEDSCKSYYEKKQKKLNSYDLPKDTGNLRSLSIELDTRIKMEDYLIRSREAEHIKFTL